MSKNELINKVASGLRKMNIRPDYLIYFDGKLDFTWDEDTICGIKVLHSSNSFNAGYDGNDFVFHPAFKNETNEMEIYYFQKGFTDTPEKLTTQTNKP